MFYYYYYYYYYGEWVFKAYFNVDFQSNYFFVFFVYQPSLFTFDDIFMYKSYNLGFNLIYHVDLLLIDVHHCTQYLLPENDFTFNIIVTTNFLRTFDST